MSNEGFCPTPLPDAPSGEPRKTLLQEAVEVMAADPGDDGWDDRYDALLARLREAGAAENALDEARICADADGVRIRELVAERAGLVSLLAVNEAEGETLAGTVRALYEANERGVARYARLRGYAMHKHDCDIIWSNGGRGCTCGLAGLLEEKP